MKTGSLRKLVLCVLCLAIGAALWLPMLHLLFRPSIKNFRRSSGIAPQAQDLAAWHLHLWTNPEQRQQEILRMRTSNAEWDFMGRTFLVLAFANMAMRDETIKLDCLQAMDAIIDETLRLEKQHGIFYFLMGYARGAPFVYQPARSIFQDGEIALMLAARRLVEENELYATSLHERIQYLTRQMEAAPLLCGESYPNECWMFCNTVALAAIRMSDVLDDTNHQDFFDRWISRARTNLVDPETGLLVSSFTLNGHVSDGPEGSTIWVAAHCLRLIDEPFAEDQYHRAKKELARVLFGFGYAREWPESYVGPQDIDSGLVLPLLNISASASGLAFLGAASFNDEAYLLSLLTSLNYGGFPIRNKNGLRYAASNQVGDAAILYALVQGPLWDKVLASVKGGDS